MKLTHTQAYLLGSIAKHADHHRRAIASLELSLQSAKTHGVLASTNTEAANKARFAERIVEELIDQLYEEFADVDPKEITRIVKLTVEPTERGLRHRFSVDDEV
jgi:hypothetical protein